jgi:ABC-type transport system involved in cytochrome bd biosynthesis fused ATPase/permease subunit
MQCCSSAQQCALLARRKQMIEAVIYALIYICLLALVIYLILWVLGSVIGVQLPPKVVQILWVIFALVCILILVRLLLPHAGRVLGAMLPLLA